MKTHKPNNPLRPIISSVGSVHYSLSKYLVKLLSPLLGTISNSHIKNNSDFIDKIKSISTNNSCLVSFDVVSLFTKVPVDDLLDFLAIELNNFNFEISTSAIIQLIQLCVKDLKFVFNQTFYSQSFGLAMGNPLSPLLSNLYMEFFEQRILKLNSLNFELNWYRYVDDIFCIWPTSENINDFLYNLNNLVPSIKFTLEHENNNKLSFLDLLIERTVNGFKFDIFRKPTHKDAYIHYYSFHQNSIKKCTFSSMFLRALRCVNPEYFDNEIQRIYNIGSNLCYPLAYLDSCFESAKKPFYHPKLNVDRNFSNTLVIPYHPNLESCKKLFSNLGINLIFSYKSNIKHILVKNSPLNDNGCVYKIPCSVCNKIYVGQTGRCLDKRINEHKYNIRTGNENSALFIHTRDNDHLISFQNSSKYCNSNCWYSRNIIESILIEKTPTMNLSPGLFNIDPFASKFILKQYKISVD